MKEVLFALGFLIVGSLVVGYLINDLIPTYNQNKVNEQDIISYQECANKTLHDTTDCLINYVRPFYNYTVRTDVVRPLEDIKANGGDCYDYSVLYNKMALSLGFHSKVVDMKTNATAGHAITIISNEEGYCVIDQMTRSCTSLSTDD